MDEKQRAMELLEDCQRFVDATNDIYMLRLLRTGIETIADQRIERLNKTEPAAVPMGCPRCGCD